MYDGQPVSVVSALGMLDRALSHLAAVDTAGLPTAVQAEALLALAKPQGVHPVTEYPWYREGKLPVPARRAGRLILVDARAGTPVGTVAVYARVSSAGQRAALDRQAARVTAWAARQGLAVGRVVTEVGSALNGNRRTFLALLRDPSVTTIVAEHGDRFARFGAEYEAAALSALGRLLLVVDLSELDDDLVRDVTEILTSLCARLYGRGAAANRVRRAVETATKP